MVFHEIHPRFEALMAVEPFKNLLEGFKGERPRTCPSATPSPSRMITSWGRTEPWYFLKSIEALSLKIEVGNTGSS